jgi:hypothetical protein
VPATRDEDELPPRRDEQREHGAAPRR